jgi:hypothetical protein
MWPVMPAVSCVQLDSVLGTSQALLQATKEIRSAFLVLWWRTTAGHDLTVYGLSSYCHCWSCRPPADGHSHSSCW